MKKDKKDLSVWDFVANNSKRPILNNVHYNHEDKVAVGTNRHKLFVSHKDYRPLHKKYEVEVFENGKISKEIREYSVYDKHGNGVEGVFPNYKAVIPHDYNLTPVTLASEEEIRKRIAKAKAEHKSLGRIHPNKRIAISMMGEDEYGLRFVFRNKLVSMENVNIMLSAGLEGWKIAFLHHIDGSGTNVEMFVKKFDNGDVILLSPTRIIVDDSKFCNNDQINKIKYQSFDHDLY